MYRFKKYYFKLQKSATNYRGLRRNNLNLTHKQINKLELNFYFLQIVEVFPRELK